MVAPPFGNVPHLAIGGKAGRADLTTRKVRADGRGNLVTFWMFGSQTVRRGEGAGVFWQYEPRSGIFGTEKEDLR